MIKNRWWITNHHSKTLDLFYSLFLYILSITECTAGLAISSYWVVFALCLFLHISCNLATCSPSIYLECYFPAVAVTFASICVFVSPFVFRFMSNSPYNSLLCLWKWNFTQLTHVGVLFSGSACHGFRVLVHGLWSLHSSFLSDLHFE